MLNVALAGLLLLNAYFCGTGIEAGKYGMAAVNGVVALYCLGALLIRACRPMRQDA